MGFYINWSDNLPAELLPALLSRSGPDSMPIEMMLTVLEKEYGWCLATVSALPDGSEMYLLRKARSPDMPWRRAVAALHY